MSRLDEMIKNDLLTGEGSTDLEQKTESEAIIIRILDRAKFAEMVKTTSKACSKSDTTPLLTYIRMDIRTLVPKAGNVSVPGNGLFFYGGNGTAMLVAGTAAEKDDPASVIESNKDLSILVPADSFDGICSSLPKGDVVMEYNGGKLTIKVGKNSKYSLDVLNSEEYPMLSPEKGLMVAIPAMKFISALKRTIYSVSTKNGDPDMFFGVNITSTPDGLSFTSTDRNRASCDLLDVTTENVSFILAKQHYELVKLVFDKQDVPANIVFGPTQLRITMNGITLLISSLNGTFPKVGKLFPTQFAAECTFERKLFLDALNRLEKFGKSKEHALTCSMSFKDQEFIIETKEQSGNGREVISAIQIIGEMPKTSLNLIFFQDTTKALDDFEKIRIGWSAIKLPVLVIGLDEEGNATPCKGLILPYVSATV
jgi:DNA polymerase III sliding clamp (beta) subunit (PCNA family)